MCARRALRTARLLQRAPGAWHRSARPKVVLSATCARPCAHVRALAQVCAARSEGEARRISEHASRYRRRVRPTVSHAGAQAAAKSNRSWRTLMLTLVPLLAPGAGAAEDADTVVAAAAFAAVAVDAVVGGSPAHSAHAQIPNNATTGAP